MNKKTNRKRRGNKRGGLTKKEKTQVKRIVNSNIETKYQNIAQGQLQMSSTPRIASQILVNQGFTDSERIGDRIKLKSIKYKFFLHQNPTFSTTYNYARIIVFQWHAMTQTAANPVAGDILLQGAGGGEDYTSQYNHDKRTQYHIMWDKTFKLVGNALSDEPFQDSAAIMASTPFLIPKWKVIDYDAASGTTFTNKIFVLDVSSGTSSLGPIFFYTGKLLYTDA